VRRIGLAVIVFFGYLGAVVLGAPAASAAPALTCTGDQFGGTFASVSVPAGADCGLFNVTVRGDVKAKDAKSLNIENSLIKGNLYVKGTTRNGDLDVCNTTIKKSVDVASLNTGELEGDRTESCGPVTVNGSVNVHDNDFIEVSWTKIGGSLSAGHNGEVELENNNISGDRTCGNNGSLDINDEPDTVHGLDNCLS